MKKIFLTLLVCLTIFSCYGVINMEASTVPMHKEQITVHQGDSLWTIAGRWTEKNEDVREVIYRIEQENKLTGSEVLQPGQKIIVPVRMEQNKVAQR
ncbi:MAG: LysM peptidoglycan-binding domain-containing protein [Acidaminococcaceae bacterium]|nr:LysM peptidoglycan-binding domain-containing protein [Acidaminococcaceae bacterium]